MPFLTIFTPAYNRADTLRRTYESLKVQTVKDFEWIIIDDGSSDNTELIVADWIKIESDFPIYYYYKENGGLHTAYNLAISKIRSSVLSVCIDSDDYIPANSVEIIKETWLEHGNSNLAGIIGLDSSADGKIIGGVMPTAYTVNLIDNATGKADFPKGDKKIVVRTDLYKSVSPMKEFPGEKNFNPHYMHLEISRKYDFIPLNEPLCIVDYQPGGMTDTMFWQYYNSPNSFLEIRKQFFTFEGSTLKHRILNMIHLNSSALLSGRTMSEFRVSEHKLLMIICYLPGLMLSMLTRIKGSRR